MFLIAAAMLASCGGNPLFLWAAWFLHRDVPSSRIRGLPGLGRRQQDRHRTLRHARRCPLHLWKRRPSSDQHAGFKRFGRTWLLWLTSEQVFNFVYITEVRAGDGHGSLGVTAAAALYAGIEGDQVSEFLSNASDLQGKTRAYVAISFGSTVKWTKNKNASMDAKIQQLVDASK